MKTRFCLLWFVLTTGFIGRGANAQPSAPTQGVQITQLPDRLRVEINGRLFTEYFFKDVPRPYCYPLMGPGPSLGVA